VQVTLDRKEGEVYPAEENVASHLRMDRTALDPVEMGEEECLILKLLPIR